MNEMKHILEDIDVPSLTIEKFMEEKVTSLDQFNPALKYFYINQAEW